MLDVLDVLPEPVPLATGADGVVRVRESRVTLDSVVHAFVNGATAEEIAAQYSSVDLADVYAVLTYYLRHQTAVDGYLAWRLDRSRQVRAGNEELCPPDGVRARLLARRSA